jgi:hypothetical protein
MANENQTTPATKAIENVTVTVSPVVARAIRLLAATDKKRSASQLADDLLLQTVKGRVNSKRDKAKDEFSKSWENAAMHFGAGNMPLTKEVFVTQQMAKLDELIGDLAKL